jgi:carbamoyl-phosphate synthase large subunit
MMEQRTQSPEYTVAVTGVGALIGQGIVKALRRSPHSARIVGLDRNPDSVGKHLCDKFYCKPECDESEAPYEDFWLDLLRTEHVDLVLPGIEIDVFYLDSHRQLFEKEHAVVCLNGASLIQLSKDKWVLGQKLQSLGMNRIPSMIAGDWDQCMTALGPPPLLMKPRQGNGSRGIVRIFDADDFTYWKRKTGGNFMVQKIVGSDDEEYTIGSFGFGDGAAVEPIVLRRRLSGAGNTQFAEVVKDRALEEMTARLNGLFCPLGPTNYQFRKDRGMAYLLEINPRFSSTASIRAAFGYNEASMAIEFFLKRQRPSGIVIHRGRASRYTEDYIQYDRDCR